MTSSSLCRLRHKTRSSETGKGEKTRMGGGERGIVDGEGHCHWNELFKARRGRYGSSDDIIWGSEIKKMDVPVTVTIMRCLI